MAEYLSLAEIQERSADILSALESLINTKAVANKPNAKQWRFLRDGVRCLFSPCVDSEFQNISPVRAAQLKFETEDRLKRYYLRPGRPLDFVFTLVHKSDLAKYGLIDREDYPSLAGYCVLIRDKVDDNNKGPDDLKKYLERVITEAMDAEFRAYAALPRIDQDDLNKWFVTDSPAMKEIMNLLTRHQKKGWIISNSLNPSTKRLLDIKVKKIENLHAFINTMEYWFLRWWDVKDGSYTYPYRETNRQMYVLKKEPDGWKVFKNLRPSPRSSTPHRWKNHKKQ